MISRNIWLAIIVFICLFTACTNELPPTLTPLPTTAVVPATPSSTLLPSPTTDNPSPTSSPPSTPSPITDNHLPITYPPLSRAPITDAERLTAQMLESNYPPDRDDIALFAAYKGATPSEDYTPLAEVLQVSTRQNISVNNTDLNTIASPEFVLEYVSDHAYFWFDTTPGMFEPTQAELKAMGAGFDEIYEENRFYFGTEASPGIDGDPRIHIVNASPLNLCDVGLEDADWCGLLGYFGSDDLVPQSVNPASNAREMFVMNGRYFGTTGYLDTLAHEFRHMIESNYDVNDWDWEVEGSAMLAEELLGYAGDGVARGNLFLEDPDQQLNRWTDGDSTPHYGQGYLLNRYIFNRLGVDLYREFAIHPAPAFAALDMLAQANGLDFATGLEVWLDWLAALAIHDHPDAPEKYALNEGVDTADTQPLEATETTVNQYAADYYEIPAGQKGSINFTGSNHAPLLPVLPASGAQMWLANRANYSTARLTRAFDLSGVTAATLNYDVYHDIETGYDFAYVTISTDGGQTWQPLAGKQMQGTDFEDDPSDSALTERFYTGESGDWVSESIDLSPYAGQEVLLRFEYVTDPILTFGGLALDNIVIPEIGYVDDAEADTGWQGEGFVRATGYVPQAWHLGLISFGEAGPLVEWVAVAEDGTAVIPLPNSRENAILIVAATAPTTLQPAHYQLAVNE